jgi:ABC-type transport system involved in cytochrome c biogenesis permease component
MPQVLDPRGEARPLALVLMELAQLLDVKGFFQWQTESGTLDAILHHPSGHVIVGGG